jgi:integrase/recombinase XerD
MDRINKIQSHTYNNRKPVGNNEIIKQYLEDAKCRGLTKRTVENYKSCVKIFAEYINKPLSEVEINDLKNFLHTLKEKENKGRIGYSNKTISRYFSAIQSIFEYLEFESYIDKNIIPKFRRRYLQIINRNAHNNNIRSERKLISIEQMRQLINTIMDPRDKAVMALLAKTGVRRNELINIDIKDIDWEKQSINLKKTPKRSNNIVFFDDECARILKRWIISRSDKTNPGKKALFINERGGRLNRSGIYALVVKHAERIGLHNPISQDLNERFTPHCCRHWFTTHLRRAGMQREYIKELRGDTRNEAIDIYHHIDLKDLREAYLTYIPQLNIM